MLGAAGARVNETDGIGATPLMHAAWRGDEDIVERLLAGGANANALTVQENSALHFAFAREHSYIVHLLMNAGARSTVNATGNFPHNCNPILAPAASEGEGEDISIAERLLGEELGTVVFQQRQMMRQRSVTRLATATVDEDSRAGSDRGEHEPGENGGW
jgi:hypothetical protein